MSLTILGIGKASPPRQIPQAAAAEFATEFTGAEPGHRRLVAAIYRQTRIRARGSVLLEEAGERPFAQTFFPPAAETTVGGPTTAARMRRYAEEAGGLAVEAVRGAIGAAGVDPGSVTDLVTCSCTGFANPGVDLEIVAALGLAPTVSRTHVGFMGCHGAFNALRVADALAAVRPGGLALVASVELCSLHFQYGDRSDLIVANSIFADGAAALVGAGPSHPRSGASGAWRLERQWSSVLADSAGDMGWIIGDHGFEMNLSATVPLTIAREIEGLVRRALGDAGLTMADVGSWAVHPGGPRVLAGVQEALGLPEGALAASADVLAAHGNMSSATILFIVERLVREGAASPCVAMAFGPGLTVELALLTRRGSCPAR
jgi:predicted naringenin-chalcone synthase